MASPLSDVTWDAFPDAISYDVVVVDSNGNASLGSPILASKLDIPAPTNTIKLKDLSPALSAGDYRLQVRAKVADYYTDYSSVLNFTFDVLVPGTVQNVVINPL